jgi:hypothetical protein
MSRPTPPGFNKADAIAGIRLAMNFGAPNAPGDRATFCWTSTSNATAADESGVPFSPAARPTRSTQKVTVPCAVDYADGSDQTERWGTRQRSRIVVTLLEPEWAKVKDFEFVVYGGEKYLRRTHEIIALGSLDVHTVYCVTEDQG